MGADPLAKRGKKGVAALAKPFMGDPEFSRGYAIMLARQESLELGSVVSAEPRGAKKKRGSL